MFIKSSIESMRLTYITNIHTIDNYHMNIYNNIDYDDNL